MPVDYKECPEDKIACVTISGKLTKEDYETFVPQLEKFIQENGAIKMLFEMHDFHGWTLGAMWEDTKFDIHHFHDIAKLAMIGEKAWQKGMAVFCKPFVKAKIEYFTHDQKDEALAWLKEE